MGIEPTLFAWEARVLPLNDAREARRAGCQHGVGEARIVARGGVVSAGWAVFWMPPGPTQMGLLQALAYAMAQAFAAQAGLFDTTDGNVGGGDPPCSAAHPALLQCVGHHSGLEELTLCQHQAVLGNMANLVASVCWGCRRLIYRSPGGQSAPGSPSTGWHLPRRRLRCRWRYLRPAPGGHERLR